jgi:hypothetical protein
MKEEKLIAENTARLNITKIVGYYGISKKNNNKNKYSYVICIGFTQKPSWFHRMMNKLLIGWEWFDEKN